MAQQLSPDPFSFRGVPLQSTEQQFVRTLPEFHCGTPHPPNWQRADRVCSTSNVEALWYGGNLATSISAEFIRNALCSVQVNFLVKRVAAEAVATALTRHLGSPKWVLEHYADGREAIAGAQKDRRSPVTHYSWLWQGEESFVRMIEHDTRLWIEYSTPACEEAREGRKHNGTGPNPSRRQM